MAPDPNGRSRFGLRALGAALFVLAFVSVFLLTLSGDALLPRVRSALARRGYALSGGEARLRFPLSIRIDDATLSTPSGGSLHLETLVAGWDFAGLLRGLPGHLGARRKSTSIDLLTSPRLWDPGRGRLEIENLSSEDVAALFPATSGTAFRIRRAAIGWTRSAKDAFSGSGTAELSTLRVPVPAKDSPVSEAVLDNVQMKFTVRNGDFQVSSLTGRYEGSEVDGTGAISRIGDPSAATITFHLRIRNPLEGRIAAIFDLMAKNAKNANLRITGPLLSPAGEFQFF